MWLQLFYYCKNTLLNILNGEIMTDCYIYDTVRTPRGKGKKNGSLHEVTAVELATQVLNNIKNRNSIDTSDIDDVVLGCVSLLIYCLFFLH